MLPVKFSLGMLAYRDMFSKYKSLPHASPCYNDDPITQATIPIVNISCLNPMTTYFAAAPVAATGPSVDVLVGEPPSFVAWVVIPVGALVAAAEVPLKAPSEGSIVPFNGTGTCGLGFGIAASVCRPV